MMLQLGQIAWLIQDGAGHPGLARGIAPRNLLSARETAVYQSLAVAKRRRDWLLGRWTAKQLLATMSAAEGRPFAAQAFSILAAEDGAPQVWTEWRGQLLPVQTALSISHAHGVAFCAAHKGSGWSLGVDIERIEPRHAQFAQTYFTAAEMHRLNQSQPEQVDCLLTAIWSAKEAALKALRLGLRADTREVQVNIRSFRCEPQEWSAFTIEWRPGAVALQGWWRFWRGFVLAMAVRPLQAAHSGADKPLPAGIERSAAAAA